MEQLKLNMIPNGVNPVFHASQYDKGRQIRFVLDETLSGAEVIVSYRAKDGTEHGNVQMSVSGNTITDTIPEEVLTDYGIIEGEVNIDGIGSLNFFVEVEKDAYDGGVITTQTATGAIATFETNIETTFVSLKSDINPVQDLHGYSKPWNGGGGKNKYCDIFSQYTQPYDYRVFPIALTQGQTYKLWASLKGSAVSGIVVAIVKDGTQYSNFVGFTQVINSSGYINEIPSFTVDATFTNPKLVVYASNETVFNSIFANYNVQLELGNQATSFEPYSNICPISGFSALNVTRTGVNLWGHNDVTIGSAAYVINNEDIYLPAGTYTIQWKFSGTTGASSGRIDDVDGNAITTFGGTISVGLNSKTITIPTGKTGVKFKFFSAAIGTYSDFEISIGSTTPEYTPYNGQTATVNFGQTVYGGVADVTNGKVNVAYAKKKINELTWNYVNIAGSERFYSTSLSTEIEKPTTIDIVSTLKCSCYETVSERQYAQFTSDNIIAVQTTGFIVIRDTNYTSVSDLLNAVGNQEICYPLATPIEITTTPENLTAIVGQQNNVYGDTNGDTEVEYYIEV